MSASPLVTRLISSSVAIANQAGKIIRDVMAKGELAIVEKEVYILYYTTILIFFPCRVAYLRHGKHSHLLSHTFIQTERCWYIFIHVDLE